MFIVARFLGGFVLYPALTKTPVRHNARYQMREEQAITQPYNPNQPPAPPSTTEENRHGSLRFPAARTTKGDLLTAFRVPNKPGFVLALAPNQAMLIPRVHREVKDPYTNKIFLVP